jgi:hypothetical protein
MKAGRFSLFIAMGCLVLCGSFFSAQPADAQTINLTLYFDWDQDWSFSSTSLTLNTSNLTFTTGDGGAGTWSMFGQCFVLLYETGRSPIYSGPFYGFMDSRDAIPTSGPGYFVFGGAARKGTVESKGAFRSDGTPY